MSKPNTPKPYQIFHAATPAQGQFAQLAYVYRWKIPRWSDLKPLVEYKSAPFAADGLQWVLKIYKGRQKNQQALSLYLGIDESQAQSMRGVRKKVHITFILENLRTRNLDLVKIEHPVWFCEKHSAWGEENYMNLDEMGPYIDKNTVSLCVSIEILEDQSDLPEPVVGSDPASHPFARLVNNQMFSDVTFRLIEDKEPSSPSTPTSTSPSTTPALTPDKERVFYAHKSILAASSPWFEALFSNGMRETYEKEITLEGVDHAGFLQLLRYCYTLQYPQVRSRREAERLLALADRFEIVPVREECFRYLRVELGMSNVWGTWAVADKYTSERTSTACRQFVALHLAELLDHPSTMNAKSHVLRMAFELDEVNVPSEQKIYETIVRWARYHDSAVSPRGAELDATRSADPYASAAGFDVLSLVDAVVSAPAPAVSSYASSELDWDAADSPVYPTRSESPSADDDMEISSPTALMPISASPSSSSITVPQLSSPPAPVLAPAPIFRRYTICSGKTSVRATSGTAPAARGQHHYRASVHSARQYFLPELLACVRFPLMEKKYLIEVVEKDDMVMQADGMKDLLLEAYRHHLIPNASPTASPRMRPRKKFNRLGEQ